MNLIENFHNGLDTYESLLISNISCLLNHKLNSPENDFSFVEDFQINQLRSGNAATSFSKNLISEFQKIENNTKIINQETSGDFNILRLFNINETLHSILLANLLNPNSLHGQAKLFLDIFLKKIDIEEPQKGNWSITVEKGKVDILLKRKNPHSVIIIENKSNNAIDQPNQLYRYWYNEIYLPYRHESFNFDQTNHKRFKIIYLVSNDWKSPSGNTTLKPNGWHPNLPIQIPIEPLVWRFDNEIKEILNIALNEISPNNFRLREYIKQYIEFWQ